MEQPPHQSRAGRDAPLILQAAGIGRLTRERRLLSDVSLDLHAGDRVAVVGPNGSGKSLLLRTLAMLEPVNAGKVLWRGRQIPFHEVPYFRCRVTYVHQQASLPEGSVEAALRQPYLFRVHAGRRFSVEFHQQCLKTLNLPADFLQRQVQTLSGGETQVVAILRTLQLEPEVLLLDESTSALDEVMTVGFERLVNTW